MDSVFQWWIMENWQSSSFNLFRNIVKNVFAEIQSNKNTCNLFNLSDDIVKTVTCISIFIMFILQNESSAEFTSSWWDDEN